MNKRLRRSLAACALAVGVTVSAAGCMTGATSNGNTAESAQQQQDTTNLENSQKLPVVYFSQERQNLIDIELAEVNDVRTTTFIQQYGSADPMFSCPSIGFGIPDSASLSNPFQIGWNYNSWNNGQMDSGVVGQMDPNGIYAPTSSDGTWIICLSDNGIPYISRFEDKTDTVGAPAKWDYKLHALIVTGAPTALATTIDGKKEAVRKDHPNAPSFSPAPKR